MRYLHELSAALVVLFLMLLPVQWLPGISRGLKWTAACLVIAIIVGGLLIRGFSGKDPMDLAGEFLAKSICSVREFEVCHSRHVRALEIEQQEQARLRAHQEREQARSNAEEAARREQARRAAEEARQAEERRRKVEAEDLQRQKQLQADEARRQQARREAELQQARQEQARQEQARLEEQRQRRAARAEPTPRKSAPTAAGPGDCPGWMFYGQTCTRGDGKRCRQEPGYNNRICE